MEPNKSNLVVQERGNISVVTFLEFSVLDRTHIDKLGDELLKLVDEGGRKKILINFEGVEYLSSTVLGKLIALHKRIALARGELKLCAIKPSILEIFEITKLDRVFNIYDDQQQALDSFGHAS